MESNLHIQVYEKVLVEDIFYVPQLIQKVKKIFSHFISMVREIFIFTLTWQPLLARCPADNKIKTLTTSQAAPFVR